MKHKNLLSHITLGKEILNFTAIQLLFFGGCKYWESINKIYFGEKNYKYFIGCLHNGNKAKPLHVILPKTDAYVKSGDGETTWMYILIKDDELLEKHNTIWDKVSADMKEEFDREPVYNKNDLKTKLKSHGNEVTEF